MVANETSNVVLDHIQAKCPSLTVGQVNAIYTIIMSEKLEDNADNKITRLPYKLSQTITNYSPYLD